MHRNGNGFERAIIIRFRFESPGRIEVPSSPTSFTPTPSTSSNPVERTPRFAIDSRCVFDPRTLRKLRSGFTRSERITAFARLDVSTSRLEANLVRPAPLEFKREPTDRQSRSTVFDKISGMSRISRFLSTGYYEETPLFRSA